MIATKESFEPHSSEQLPASKRIYVQGTIHKDIRVPMREIELTPTQGFNGQIEVNDPVRVYDCSGPWGDPEFNGSVTEGLPALRAKWIRVRGDVEEYKGRETKPQDDGYLSKKHARIVRRPVPVDQVSLPVEFTGEKRKPLRAKPAKVVTQLAYARAGIITPEMEFIAIRENMGRARISDLANDIVRNQLDKQHAGSTQLSSNDASSPKGGRDAHVADYTPSVFRRFPQRIPTEITPEFVRCRSRRRPRHHPGQHQPPRVRADDHRAQLPGEDQRQHRQQRRRLQHRGGSREDALGHQVGRGHRHGPLHRQEHPRHARMDSPQLARAHRHRADLSGARKSGRQSRGTHLGTLSATRSSSSASRAWITSPSTPACCCASCRSPRTA